jgi:hypothetical protein
VLFGAIPDELWKAECCRSAEDFREAHRRSWPDYRLDNDFEMIATHFELVVPGDRGSGPASGRHASD